MAVETIAEAAMVVRPDFTRAGGEVRRQGRNIGRQIGEETAGAYLTNFAGAVSRGAGKVGTVMEKVAATFFVGQFVKQIVGFGLKTAASLEQAQIGFETLLGSASKARAFLGDLQHFAAATPFTLPGLIESSRTLIGVGVSSKQVIPFLRAFGDAAGAVGVGQEAFQRIVLATSQAISAGKFQVGDLNQIMTNGIPIYKILSEAMGKPVSTIRKMASEGKLLSKDVLPLLQRQMEKDYGGAMAKQSMTLAGVWSTLTDTVSIGLANALHPLVPLLSEAIPKAAQFFSTALKVASGYISNLAEGFKHGKAEGEGLGGFLARIGAAMSQLVAGFSSGKTAVDGVTSPMHNFGVTLHETILPFLISVAAELTEKLIPALARLATNGFALIAPIVYSFAMTLHSLVIPGLAGLANFLNSNQALTRNLALSIGIIVGVMKVWELVVKASEVAMKLWGFTLGTNGIITKVWTATMWLAEAPLHAQNAAMAFGNSLFITRVRVMAVDAAAWLRSTGATIANTASVVGNRIATLSSRAAEMAVAAARGIAAGATIAYTAAVNASTVAARVARIAAIGLWTAMRANPVGAVITILTLLVAAVIYAYKHSETFRKIVQAAWRGIQAAASAVWGWMSTVLWPSLHRSIDQVSGFFRGFGHVVATVFHAWQTVIATEWRIVSGTFNAIRNVITNTLPNAFRNGVAAIGRFWEGLRAKAKAPISFVVNTVINPFLAGFQRIASAFGVKAPGPIRGFAEGGRIPGAPSSRDNRVAWLKNGAGKVISNIQVATGEFIVNARDTMKALPLLHWINDGMRGGPAEVARRLGRRPVDKMGDGSEGWAFAGGGLVGWVKDIWGAMSNPAKLIKAPFEAVLNRIPGAGMIKDVLVGMGKKLIGGFTSWLGGTSGGVSGGGNVLAAQHFVRAQAGKPYVWASAGPGGFDCSGIVSAVFNVLKGKNPYSHTFSTEGLPGPWFQEGVRVGPLVAGWAHPGQRGASANVGHTAGMIGGLPFSSTGSRGVQVGPAADKVQDFAHIGVARANGGLVELHKVGQVARADFGAVTLTPGSNLIYNGLGRPEPLETAGPRTPARMHPDDIAALADAIGGVIGSALTSTVGVTRLASRKTGARGR